MCTVCKLLVGLFSRAQECLIGLLCVEWLRYQDFGSQMTIREASHWWVLGHMIRSANSLVSPEADALDIKKKNKQQVGQPLTGGKTHTQRCVHSVRKRPEGALFFYSCVSIDVSGIRQMGLNSLQRIHMSWEIWDQGHTITTVNTITQPSLDRKTITNIKRN